MANYESKTYQELIEEYQQRCEALSVRPENLPRTREGLVRFLTFIDQVGAKTENPEIPAAITRTAAEILRRCEEDCAPHEIETDSDN